MTQPIARPHSEPGSKFPRADRQQENGFRIALRTLFAQALPFSGLTKPEHAEVNADDATVSHGVPAFFVRLRARFALLTIRTR